MKFQRLFRALLPHGLSVLYLERKADRQRSIPRKQFERRFAEVAPLLADNGRFTCSWEDRFPCLDDATGTTPFEPHYLYHPAWAARQLARSRPERHVDISSSLRFVAMVSAFVPIDFYDFRPANVTLEGLRCRAADVTALPFEDDSIDSLSCMHVVEHIGLERYGDHFDPRGDVKAMAELGRVLSPGGQLLFVVPVGGKARINYNAHRVYTLAMVRELMRPLELREFSLVTDTGDFIDEASEADSDRQNFGCGCFCFHKPLAAPENENAPHSA